MDSLHVSSLGEARAVLRRHQSSGIHSTSDVDVAALAREALESRLAFDHVDNDKRIGWRGAFRYPLDQEERRRAAAVKILDRVDPGRHEDPNYFALLTYHAAAVELATADIVANAADLPTVVFGTVHNPIINAFAQRIDGTEVGVVMLSSGLIEFVYQAAKAVVAASEPTTGAWEETGATSVSTDLDEVAARTGVDSAGVQRLYSALEADFFNGYPRAFTNEVVPELHAPSLSVLVGMAERFVLAHEYAHVQMEGFFFTPDGGLNPSWGSELSADIAACIHTVWSAHKLDLITPEIALGCATFALKCLEVRRRAAEVLMHGSELPVDVSATHPPEAIRSRAIAETADAWFVPTDEPARKRGLMFDPSGEQAEPGRWSRGFATPLDYFADVLDLLWQEARPLLEEDRSSGRPLHGIYR